MKKQVKKEEAINIAEVTKLYATYAEQQKELEAKTKEYKEKILMFAEQNRNSFKGKTLDLPNNVRVERRETEKAVYREDDIDLGWLKNAADADLETAISIKIDPKTIKKIKLNDIQTELLDQIEFGIEIKESLAVCVTT